MNPQAGEFSPDASSSFKHFGQQHLASDTSTAASSGYENIAFDSPINHSPAALNQLIEGASAEY